MYTQTRWQDHVTQFQGRYKETDNHDGTITHTPAEGQVIQQGTPQNATHFNNLEHGLQDVSVAHAILANWAYLNQLRDDAHMALMDAEVLGETHEVTLTNNLTAPFNSSVDNPKTINLDKRRKNLYYSVETEIKSHKGPVGEIVITDKAENGFKVSFTGSGTEVVLTVRIKGGMT